MVRGKAKRTVSSAKYAVLASLMKANIDVTRDKNFDDTATSHKSSKTRTDVDDVVGSQTRPCCCDRNGLLLAFLLER